MSGSRAGSRGRSRARAREYVSGLVAGLERKNAWALAEQAGEVSPDGRMSPRSPAGAGAPSELATAASPATPGHFELFDLLGLQLSPRIRDLGKITLYRTGTRTRVETDYPQDGPLLTRRVNVDLSPSTGTTGSRSARTRPTRAGSRSRLTEAMIHHLLRAA